MLRILSISIIFLLISCTSRTIYKKPDDLIPKDQMVDLWTDIYIANGARAVKNSNLERKVNYMPLVYEKYKIDSARFMRSNIYYASKIEVYEELFQKVQKKLKKLRDTYDPEMADIDPKLPIWKRDSIRNARKLIKEGDMRQQLIEDKKIPKEIKKIED